MADAVEKRRSPFAKQVMLANLVIVAGFLGVLGLFAYLVSTQSAANRWSSYKPTGSDVYDKAQNTADHVAPAYKYNGQPIAVVQAQPLLYQDAAVDGICTSGTENAATSVAVAGAASRVFEKAPFP